MKRMTKKKRVVRSKLSRKQNNKYRRPKLSRKGGALTTNQDIKNSLKVTNDALNKINKKVTKVMEIEPTDCGKLRNVKDFVREHGTSKQFDELNKQLTNKYNDKCSNYEDEKQVGNLNALQLLLNDQDMDSFLEDPNNSNTEVHNDLEKKPGLLDKLVDGVSSLFKKNEHSGGKHNRKSNRKYKRNILSRKK